MVTDSHRFRDLELEPRAPPSVPHRVAPWPIGFLHGQRNCHCQHHRHRHFHQSRFPAGRYSFGLRAPDALDRGWNRRALRRALLWRAERGSSAVGRRISFSFPHLSSRAWIHGRHRFSHGWIRRADCAGGHAFGKYFHGVFNVGSPLIFSIAVVWIVACFPSVESASRQPRFRMLDNRKTAFDRRLHRRRVSSSSRNRRLRFLPQSGDAAVDFRRAIRGRPGLRDVFLLRMERMPATSRAKSGSRRKIFRARFLPARSCHCYLHALNAVFLLAAPREEMSGQFEVASDCRQTHFRRERQPGRWRHYLPRSCFGDQFDDLARPACDHVDGRRSFRPSTAGAKISTECQRMRLCFNLRW